jgi:hypothetical protein
MALTRRTKKLTKSMLKKAIGTHVLVCKVCHEEELEVNTDVAAVTCGMCVQLMIPAPDNYIKKEKSDKPRGWHFKSYFEYNGVVYSKGVEVSDAAEIKRLKREMGVSDTPKKVKAKKVGKKKTAKKRGRKNVKASR